MISSLIWYRSARLNEAFFISLNWLKHYICWYESQKCHKKCAVYISCISFALRLKARRCVFSSNALGLMCQETGKKSIPQDEKMYHSNVQFNLSCPKCFWAQLLECPIPPHPFCYLRSAYGNTTKFWRALQKGAMYEVKQAQRPQSRSEGFHLESLRGRKTPSECRHCRPESFCASGKILRVSLK